MTELLITGVSDHRRPTRPETSWFGCPIKTSHWKRGRNWPTVVPASSPITSAPHGRRSHPREPLRPGLQLKSGESWRPSSAGLSRSPSKDRQGLRAITRHNSCFGLSQQRISRREVFVVGGVFQSAPCRYLCRRAAQDSDGQDPEVRFCAAAARPLRASNHLPRIWGSALGTSSAGD